MDTKITEEELLACIDTSIPVINVKRMTRRTEVNNEITYVPRQTIIITFAGLVVPEYVYINYMRCPTEPYVPRVIQCV